jgi:hypothetical protein
VYSTEAVRDLRYEGQIRMACFGVYEQSMTGVRPVHNDQRI